MCNGNHAVCQFFSVHLHNPANAVILGLCGKRIKWYGILLSIPSLCLLMGIESKQMLQFLIFVVCEMTLIVAYYFLHKRIPGKFIYYAVFMLSMLPIVLIKLCVHSTRFSFLGFVGISYISFRVWQLIIAIRDGHIQQLSIFNLLYFITFFPTISSGPIDRYHRFAEDLEQKLNSKTYRNDYLMVAVKKIGMGVLYKFAFATLIQVYIIDELPEGITFSSTIIYMYAYTLYLFFDFAGYSNFAIGASYLLGIQSPENFNRPFLAHNMKEFWDRWHMSLSKWFGDYVFSRFVLNTLRKGTFKSKKAATRCGYMVTMTLMGLWHGTYLFYLLYGVYQGAMLILTDIYLKSKAFRTFKKSKYFDIVSRVVCFQVIAFGMLLFSGYLFKI
ncbi:MAG: D-alanyl-lipoteichoic acid biosynthesis protein DltB [Oscillospiraceae bacterium]